MIFQTIGVQYLHGYLQQLVEFSVCLFQAMQKETYLKLHLGHYATKQ